MCCAMFLQVHVVIYIILKYNKKILYFLSMSVFLFPELMSRITELIFIGLSVIDFTDLPGKNLFTRFPCAVHRYYMK